MTIPFVPDNPDSAWPDNPDSAWKEAAGFALLPAPDRLWRRAETPLVARYNVVGIPLEFGTNAPALDALAQDLYGDWGAPDPQSAVDPLRLHLFLHDAEETFRDGEPPAPLARLQEDYFLLTVGRSLGLAHQTAGFAFGFVTPALLAEPLIVQSLFMETMSNYLINRHRPATLHAAGLVHCDRCVLLTGNNGAGKSTLAYACLRAGFGLVAEDIVFVEPQDDRMWVLGNPWQMHLMPDAVRFFPELASARTIRMLNGETKLRVRVNSVRPNAAVRRCPVWGILSLSRARGPASRLLPADPARVRRALTHFKDDPPLHLDAMLSAADRLLEGRAAHFEVGSDLEGAVAMLRRWIETG